MIEPRIYRAAFLPTLLAVVVAMFSLETLPPPLPQGLAADVLFEGRLASVTLRGMVREHPDRRPGSAGGAAAAETVVEEFRRRGFEPIVRERFTVEGKRLVNVTATRPGATRDRIVVMAARDTRGSGPDAGGTAADTAALLELARVFEGRSARKTVVLASVDGSTLGDAGARHFAETAEDAGRIQAVVLLSNLAAPRSRGPLVVPWSNDATRGSIGVNRTVAASIREETGGLPEDEGIPGQLARLAFPLGIGGQGVLLERGLDAVRLSGSGELPPPAAGTEREPEPDAERLGDLGRAALRSLGALDGRRAPEHGPPSYVVVSRSLIPGWAIALLTAALLLPPLVASVDAFARARRRRERAGRWWGWALACMLPLLAALGVAELLALSGQIPDAPPAPFPPAFAPFDGSAALALAIVAATVAVGWLAVRPFVARRLAGATRPRAAEAGGAGAVAALMLSLAVAGLMLLNPFAALALVPAVHLWMLAMVAGVRRATGALLVAAGLVLPAAIAVYYMARLSLDPLEGAWYLTLLVTGHHVGLLTALLGCVLLGLLGATLTVVLGAGPRTAGAPPPVPAGPRLRGPGSYAGPGSLGGTESARRR